MGQQRKSGKAADRAVPSRTKIIKPIVKNAIERSFQVLGVGM
jgi:hypothetical protein